MANVPGVTYVPAQLAANDAPYTDIVTATVNGRDYYVYVTVQPALCERTGTQLSCGTSNTFLTGSGSGVLVVTAPGDWTATGPPWLSVTTKKLANGNGEVQYSFSNQTLPQSGDIVISGATTAVPHYQIALGGSILIDDLPAGRSPISYNDTVSLHATVSSGATVAWQADSGTFTTATSANPVTFKAPASGASSRVTVTSSGGPTASKDIPLTQTICEAGTSPCATTKTIGSAAGSGSLSVTKGGPWQITSNGAAWVHFTTSSFTDNQTVSYNYDANATGSSRTATLTILSSGNPFGNTFTVVQSGGIVSVNPPSRSPIGPGETQTFTVTPSDAVISRWDATVGSITSTGIYTAPSAVTTPAYASITATTIDGVSNPQRIDIQRTVWNQQFAATCVSDSNCPMTMQVDNTSANWTLAVTKVPSAGAWSATADYPPTETQAWITFSSSAGTGNGNIAFSTLPNGNTGSRSATIKFAGALAAVSPVTVTQPGRPAACPGDMYISPQYVVVPAGGHQVFNFLTNPSTYGTVSWSVRGLGQIDQATGTVTTYFAPGLGAFTQVQTVYIDATYVTAGCSGPVTQTAQIQLLPATSSAYFQFTPPSGEVEATVQTSMAFLTRSYSAPVTGSTMDYAFSDASADTSPILLNGCAFRHWGAGYGPGGSATGGANTNWLYADNPSQDNPATIGPLVFSNNQYLATIENSQCGVWGASMGYFPPEPILYDFVINPLIVTFKSPFSGPKKVFGRMYDFYGNLLVPWTLLGGFTVTRPDLIISSVPAGDFRQGQTGATYTLTVSNVGTGTTSNAVTVSDTLPPGLTAVTMSGTGWTCNLQALTCTRSDALSPSATPPSYPPIVVTVAIAANAPSSGTHTATVSTSTDANSSNNSASNVTTIIAASDLTIHVTHAGSFTLGQNGATYTLTVANTGAGPTIGTVTVTDTLPTGLTAAAVTGSGWSCVLQSLTCTRTDVLPAGSQYPPITVSVNVASNAAATVVNTGSVSGGGELNAANNSDSDTTTIVSPPDLTLGVTPSGSFTEGQTGATYTLTVSNIGGQTSSGTVTVTDSLPSGLAATSIAGTGWTCSLATLTCSRADGLASGSAYPAITLAFNVTALAGASVTNSTTVSGGGEANATNNTATNTLVIAAPANVGVTLSPSAVSLYAAQSQHFTATVTNTANTAVTWSLSPNVGSINTAGLYTAPASVTSTQTITVTATSVAAPTKSASATVTLNAPISVSITPTGASLGQSQTQQFTATVANTTNTSVTWSLSPNIGSISSSGFYTAPASIASQQTVTVTATSVADTTKYASATITLNAPVSVSINPTAVSLGQSQSQQFTATITNTTNTALTWSISPNVGSITSSGLYTAPASITSQQTVTVTATSIADATKYASATITLSALISVSVNPAAVSLGQSQTQQFTATVTNTSNTSVTWSLSPNVGSISSSGLYTAPASITSQQIVTVTATSVANNARFASAAVTLNPPVSVSVSPTAASLIQSQTQQFTATISNSSNGAVTWSLSPNVGSISSGGLYTAPPSIPTQQSVAVIATSSADPTRSASATVTLMPTGGGTSWYNVGWLYRKAITINHTKVSPSATETYGNFPVLINLTDSDLKNGAAATGADILFTAADGVTKLSHEIEKYDNTIGTLTAWVKAPSLSASVDTTLYIYYGNSSAPDQSSAAAVWPTSAYRAVYHMKDGTTSTLPDSTSNGNTAAKATAGSPSLTTGLIGSGQSFDGSTGWAYPASNWAVANNAAVMYSAWVKVTSSTRMSVFGEAGSTSVAYMNINENATGDVEAGYVPDSGYGGGDYMASGAIGLNDGNWHYLVSVQHSKTSRELYVDGNLKASGTLNMTSSSITTTGSRISGADSSGGASPHFIGLMDEFRVLATDRSADWIKTEYNNQSSPATFYSVGAQTANGTPPDTTPPVISAIAASAVTSSAATITWTTNEAADSQVEYGTTTAYGSSTTLATALVTSHSVSLSGLSASTTYHYRVKSKDAAGNLATSADAVFTTSAPPDTTPPVISAVAASAVTSSAATITWTTNEAADSQVEYGTTTAYSSSTTLATALVTSHSVSLSGLSASTTYHYRVKSKDAAGNLATSADAVVSTPASNWFNSAWLYRKRIVIDHTRVSGASAFSGFPVLISRASDTDLAARALASGADILFTADDGLTKLPHDIERFTSSTGELVAWVSVPTLSPSVDTALYLYYGNSTAADQSSAAAVWPTSSYRAVYHMKDGTTSTLPDSTSNGNTAAKATAGSPSLTTGLIGSGQSFDGSTGWAYPASNWAAADNAALMYSAWVKVTSSTRMSVFGEAGSTSVVYMNINENAAGDVEAGYVPDSGYGGGDYMASGAIGLNDGNWHYLVSVQHSKTSRELYVDGNLKASGTLNMTSSSITTTGSRISGADSSGGASPHFIGLMDEFRVLATDRSADWIKTEYNNQSSPATFYSVGAQGVQ